MPKWITIASVIATVIVLIILVAILASPSVREILFGTDSIIASRTVVESIEQIEELQTTRYHVEQVITAEEGTGGIFSYWTDDHLLLVAVGYVTAGIDLSLVNEEDITISDDGSNITIVLPEPRLIECTLDNHETYVYQRDQSIFADGQDLETNARRAAQNKIRDAALENGILNDAKNHAEFFIGSLLHYLGFTDPHIEFQGEPAETSLTCYPPLTETD